MDTEEEQVRLVVAEEDEIEDSGLHLIRKSKLLNTQIDVDASNGIHDFLNPSDEPPGNGSTIHEPVHNGKSTTTSDSENGNSTTTTSESGNGENLFLPIVADEALEPENNGGHQETMVNSIVYFDKDEGIWKCRVCSWIYQPGSLCIDHIQNAKEHLNIVMSGKTFSQPDHCFNFYIEGGNFVSAFSGEESTNEGAVIESLDIESQNGIVDMSHNLVIDYPHEEHIKDDGFSASLLQPSGVIDNIQIVSQETSSIRELESANTDLIDESDLDVAEIPLEEVLQKQKSHDLYCPNCNSCITRRVILRKRKRRTQPLTADSKHHKLEAEIETEAGADFPEPINNQDPVSSNVDSSSIPQAETYDHDSEPEIFRCFTCFSFFIPAGNGFKLFGRKNEKSTSQNDQISEPNKNWFSSIFASNKGRTPQEQGSLDKEIKERNNKGEHTPLVIDNENRLPLSSLPDQAVSPARSTDRLQESWAIKPQNSALIENMTTNIRYKTIEDTVNNALGINNGKETLFYQKYDEAVTLDPGVVTISNGECAAADDLETRLDDLETRLDGLDLIISSDRGPELLARSPADSKYDMKSNNSPDDEPMRNNFVTNNKAYIAVDIPPEYEQLTETLHDADTINFRDTDRDSISTNRNQIQIIKTDFNIQTEDNLNANWEASSKTTSYKETIVTVGPGTEVASQTMEETIVSSQQVAPLLSGQASVVDRRASEAGESYGIEIIKSIVYGGLVESITSLSVVSSAAGGGASTLHTLALGMANLLGGIFIIGHNLYQLKNDEGDDAINQVSEKNDKYRELLGKRKNFVLHAFVAILSYLIFGLLAPVTFGFSFRKSDDRELKLAAVTAASFMCILVLAIAKAYVQTPPKTYLGTVFRYMILGFMVSGVSYVAGGLFERLLDDLGLFENSTLVPTLSLPVNPSNNPAWTSF